MMHAERGVAFFNEAGARRMAPEMPGGGRCGCRRNPCFNEAGARMAPEIVASSNRVMRPESFNEAGAEWPRRSSVSTCCFPRSVGFNEAGARMAPEILQSLSDEIATGTLQ